MCYAFELLSSAKPTAARIADVFDHFQEAASEGWACWAYSNHDVVRHGTRWGLSDAAQRAYATLMMCLRGSACLYQGEELGLAEAEIAFADLQDPYGIAFWPEFKGRDGCRTPMVWENSNHNGGFTTGDPWLPISHAHLPRAVSAQEEDPSALLHHYRRAIAFRRAHAALAKGAMTDMTASGNVVHFLRRDGDETLFVAVNLGDEPATCAPPEGDWAQIGAELGSVAPGPDGRLHLGPWQPSLLRRI